MGTAPIVDLRANVEPDVSTRSEPNTATGFSYILNGSQISCRRLLGRCVMLNVSRSPVADNRLVPLETYTPGRCICHVRPRLIANI